MVQEKKFAKYCAKSFFFSRKKRKSESDRIGNVFKQKRSTAGPAILKLYPILLQMIADFCNAVLVNLILMYPDLHKVQLLSNEVDETQNAYRYFDVVRLVQVTKLFRWVVRIKVIIL